MSIIDDITSKVDPTKLEVISQEFFGKPSYEVDKKELFRAFLIQPDSQKLTTELFEQIDDLGKMGVDITRTFKHRVAEACDLSLTEQGKLAGILGTTEIAKRLYDKAIEKGISQGEPDSQAQLRLAKIHLDQGNIDLAKQFFTDVASSAHTKLDQVKAMYGIAEIVKHKEKKPAMGEYSSIIQMGIDCKETDLSKLELASSFVHGESDLSMGESLLLELQESEFLGVRESLIRDYLLVELMTKTSRFEQAETMLEELLSKKELFVGDGGVAFYELCLLSFSTVKIKVGKIDEAEHLVKTLLGEWKDTHSVGKCHFMLGEIAMKRKDYFGALESFDRTLLMSKDKALHEETLMNIFIIQTTLGNSGKQREAYDQLCSMGTNLDKLSKKLFRYEQKLLDDGIAFAGLLSKIMNSTPDERESIFKENEEE